MATSGWGAPVASAKVLAQVGRDQGGENKRPCLPSGVCLLKEAKAFNEKISYFLFPSTLLPSLTYGLETRIVFGKIPVEKFNYFQEATLTT